MNITAQPQTTHIGFGRFADRNPSTWDEKQLFVGKFRKTHANRKRYCNKKESTRSNILPVDSFEF